MYMIFETKLYRERDKSKNKFIRTKKEASEFVVCYLYSWRFHVSFSFISVFIPLISEVYEFHISCTDEN